MTTALGDQLIAAVEDARRLAPNNRHLHGDDWVAHVMDESLRGQGVPGQDPLHPGVRHIWMGNEDHARHDGVFDRYPGVAFECPRCWDPLNPKMLDECDAATVKVAAGSAILVMLLCHDCIADLDAVAS